MVDCIGLFRDRRIRFLLVGGFNTAAGYLVFVSLYLAFGPMIHYLLVAVLAHFVSVVVSFFTHRIFVFHHTGAALPAFFRFNISAALSMIFGILGMVWCVEVWKLTPVVAQAIVTLCSVVISFLLHRSFSFRTTG